MAQRAGVRGHGRGAVDPQSEATPEKFLSLLRELVEDVGKRSHLRAAGAVALAQSGGADRRKVLRNVARSVGSLSHAGSESPARRDGNASADEKFPGRMSATAVMMEAPKSNRATLADEIVRRVSAATVVRCHEPLAKRTTFARVVRRMFMSSRPTKRIWRQS